MWKILLEVIRQNIVLKSLLINPSNVLPWHLKETFPHIIWIFTDGVGDGIKSRLPFIILFTLITNIDIFFFLGATQLSISVTRPACGNLTVYFLLTFNGHSQEFQTIIVIYVCKKILICVFLVLFPTLINPWLLLHTHLLLFLCATCIFLHAQMHLILCYLNTFITQIREQMSGPEISWYEKSILGYGLRSGLNCVIKGSGPITSNFWGPVF